ncbi:hypothetical protein NFC81_09205 [Salinispirillum sp. LH 10-3-1]|uniref:Ribbon-helix-helix protein CopG domain-containing protein n=1 Tax=Salinispirillum sp. LH 10-3-1 TaxID=2952525 RepID=A0AB38YCV7_9GAMM
MPAPVSDAERIEFDLRPRFRKSDYDAMRKLANRTRTPVNVLARRVFLGFLREAEKDPALLEQAARINQERDIYANQKAA